MKLEPFIIIQDSREQCGWLFTSIKPRPEIIIQGLKTGDYSISGHEESGICVERKNKSDLFGSCGKGRNRLEREFQRMSLFDYSAIVIERTMGDCIKNPPESTKMKPKAVINTMLSWSIKYNVHVWFVEDRILAEKLCYGLFRHFLKQQAEDI